MSFIGSIVGLMFSIYLAVSTITITMEGRKVFSVVVDKVLSRLSEVLPLVGDWVERGHRAELFRLYALADGFSESAGCDQGAQDVGRGREIPWPRFRLFPG